MIKKIIPKRIFFILSLISFWQLFFSFQTRAENLVITEFMSNNKDSIKDGYGENSDWIELYNPSSSEVNLAGLFLTDNQNNLRKWSFPEGAKIKPGAYLVIFASGKVKNNPKDPESNFHTNFSIDSNGEYLALIGSDGLTIIQEFEPVLSSTPKNISYGIKTVDADLWSFGYFLEPSPGEKNNGPIVSGFVNDTKFSKDRGLYFKPFSLEISSKTEDCSIIYTEDGSTPTLDNGIEYTEPILIDETRVI